MRILNCIIVEDEPPAIEIIKTYMAARKDLKLVGIAQNCEQATDLLKSSQVDLIFLDINLPDKDGIEFVKNLDSKPKFIFTTALREFALEGFELEAIDYLLKPFSIERFNRAIAKSLIKNNENTSTKKNFTDDATYINVKSGTTTYKIELSSIVYIESNKDYCKIHFDKKSLLTRITVKNMESMLPLDTFIRIHRCYIVNKNKIVQYGTRNIQLKNQKQLPLGSKYKAAFFSSTE